METESRQSSSLISRLSAFVPELPISLQPELVGALSRLKIRTQDSRCASPIVASPMTRLATLHPDSSCQPLVFHVQKAFMCVRSDGTPLFFTNIFQRVSHEMDWEPNQQVHEPHAKRMGNGPFIFTLAKSGKLWNGVQTAASRTRCRSPRYHHFGIEVNQHQQDGSVYSVVQQPWYVIFWKDRWR